MDIDYTVAALMFPAIPLMMTMYSNRFHTLSALIRKIHDQYTEKFHLNGKPTSVLNKRTNYLKYVMGFSAFGFLFNMLTVLLRIWILFLCKIKFRVLLYLYDFFDLFIFARNKIIKRSFKISFERYGLNEKRLLINFSKRFFLKREIPL